MSAVCNKQAHSRTNKTCTETTEGVGILTKVVVRTTCVFDGEQSVLTNTFMPPLFMPINVRNSLGHGLVSQRQISIG